MSQNPPTPNELLALPLGPNDAYADNLGQFLFYLLRKTFFEQGSFDAQRPWGQTGWEDAIVHALILEGHLDGTIEGNGTVKDYNETQFGDLMNSLFDFLELADYSTFKLPPEPKDWYVLGFDENGGLVDSMYLSYTAADAEDEQQFREKQSPQTTWRAVQVPKVT